MQSAARIDDLHECADAGPNMGATLKIEQGSPNILINGKPAARVGDPVSCRMAMGSSPVISEGAPHVLFNGKPAARMGDKISNGGSIDQGSSNVFIGDGDCMIEFGDGVDVEFGDGCMVYLNCGVSGSTPPPNSRPKPSSSHWKQWLEEAGGIALILGGIPFDEVGAGEVMQAEGAELIVAGKAAEKAAELAEKAEAEEAATAEESAEESTVAKETESVGQKEMTSGGKTIEKCSPKIFEKSAKHIFRKSSGHMDEDTPENRQKLIDTASDPANFQETNSWGNDMFAKMQDDGTEIWVEVRNGGEIRNGGINEIPEYH